MLVLSRKMNESIVINDNIVVKIVGLNRGKVQVGIEAPKEVKIVRRECVVSFTGKC